MRELGQFDAGLIFIAYQKDPDRFVKIQTNLGAVDKMNEYITHIGRGSLLALQAWRKRLPWSSTL
ncbi:MAG: hypothetical protein ACLTNP_06090 [Streptococcus salivarius]